MSNLTFPEHPKKAVYRAIGDRLSGQTVAGNNIYASYVPENKARPYILMMCMSDVPRNFHLYQQDPELVMLVKGVSTDEAQALAIIAAAGVLLDDQGEQDLEGMSGGEDWHLLKVTVEERLSQDYMNGTSRVFEECLKVRIVLQEKPNA